jgi:uncharacterized protein with von Willebrand factor type A (vWA) domain
MGRIVDLCSTIAESAEEGGEGLVLPPDAWERLRPEFTDEEIEDALTLVQESILHSELVETADSLSARLVDLLGAYGEAAAFHTVVSGQAVLSVDVVGQLVRRVARLEEVLENYREGTPPDRRGFDALQRRLADHGIEEAMTAPVEDETDVGTAAGNGEDDEEEDA